MGSRLLRLLKELKVLALAAAAGVTMLACEPLTRPPATTPAPSAPSSGGEEPIAPAPTPQPRETEKSWTLSAAHFGDDGVNIWLETTNRSEPFAWDGITADNLDQVRVSIGGHALPLTNTTWQPVFESDLSGAEWKIEAEVRAGAVVLVITAEDQLIPRGVASVTMTSPGSGWAHNSIPTVTFSPPPAGSGGTTAAGTAVGPGGYGLVNILSAGAGYETVTPTATFQPPQTAGGTRAAGIVHKDASGDRISRVEITEPGTGYTTALQVVIVPAPPSGAGHAQATTSSVLQTGVTSVTITNRGSGYESPPTVSFTGGSGSGAVGEAVLEPQLGNSRIENLYWARQTLYDKQLQVRLADEAAAADPPAAADE